MCLDDHSVHVMPEGKSELLKRGYIIYIGIGGVVTGNASLNRLYRVKEMELMLKCFRKVPTRRQRDEV